MSLAHMPKWFQKGFTALWVIAAAYIVVLFAMRPFNTALSPMPFLVVCIIVIGACNWVGLAIKPETGNSQENRQAEISDYMTDMGDE